MKILFQLHKPPANEHPWLNFHFHKQTPRTIKWIKKKNNSGISSDWVQVIQKKDSVTDEQINQHQI